MYNGRLEMKTATIENATTRASLEQRRSDLPQVVRIREIRDETRTVRTFVLEATLPETQPGQFVMLWLPGVDEKPMSIADPAPLTLTIARVGPFSTALHQRKVGDRLGWRGPYGRGFRLQEDRPALLVGGGYGAVPLYFLATHAVERSIPTTVALGAHSADELVCVERFRALGVGIHLATDDGSAGHHGFVTDLASQLTHEATCQPVIYACGPEPMLVALHSLCRERDIPGQLSLERYMKCGFGICGQCALDGLLVCLDGPVFDAEQLDGVRDFGHAHRSAAGRRLPIR
jgi:dihydroorotate dehydrogenase electron transfer subunit